MGMGIVAPANLFGAGPLRFINTTTPIRPNWRFRWFCSSGGRGKKFGAGLDELLKQQLDELLALLVEQVRKVTAKLFLPMVRLEATALITYLVGLLVLKQGRKISTCWETTRRCFWRTIPRTWFRDWAGQVEENEAPPPGERDEKCGG